MQWQENILLIKTAVLSGLSNDATAQLKGFLNCLKVNVSLAFGCVDKPRGFIAL